MSIPPSTGRGGKIDVENDTHAPPSDSTSDTSSARPRTCWEGV